MFLSTLFRKIIGSKNERELKRMRKVVESINALEPQMAALSDDALRNKTLEFRERLKNGETTDQLLPEAFAVVREAGKRVMGMRHFDVQLIGGMALHEGRIAEMKTGEGKTLVATLPTYLNALTGKGVHVVTVNDYLATRDAGIMRPLYEFLGMSVGVVTSGQMPYEKRDAYATDITYGTNNEYGFDYLRDNMAFSMEDKVQRPLHYALVDEVDSILIDEARTPLIISGPVDDNVELYRSVHQLAIQLVPCESDEEEALEHGDFTIDEKQKQVELTERGHQRVEDMMLSSGLLAEGDSLYAGQNLGLLHHVNAALRANHLYHRNVDYIVANGEVVIVDEHTGRTMPGRRWSEGLHQAIEAKEGVEIQKESQTLASTTFQNYFRLYDKLSGMTGTADTEAYEFHDIYNLDVLVIPTNRPLIRKDNNDQIFLTAEEKFIAIAEDVKQTVAQQRPVLVGTASIETSELLSDLLRRQGIPHSVLNAKHHDREAAIIAQAGQPGAVTIATNMAGRGTDIMLGGNWEAEVAELEDPTEAEIEAIKARWQQRHDAVIAAGGLHVIGSERHDSRRIDNQLRGRAGRQGDPGSTRFYLSLEDNLMRLFAADKVKRVMSMLGMKKGEAIEHRMVSNAVERAQKKVESHHFDARKQVLEYDDVANDQRKVVYQQRDDILSSDDISDNIQGISEQVIESVVYSYIPADSLPEEWDIEGLERHLREELNLESPIEQWLEEDSSLGIDELVDRLRQDHTRIYLAKRAEVGDEMMNRFEKQVMLEVLDTRWKEHLQLMDHLRRGIHLRGYAQKNPKQEYKREAFNLFQQLLADIRSDVVRVLSHVQVHRQEDVERLEQARREQLEHDRQNSHEARTEDGLNEDAPDAAAQVAAGQSDQGLNISRNAPCPCGSGKKYKQCCGRLS